MKKKVVISFGTRPELIKVYPLIIELDKYFDVRIFFTFQHDKLVNNLIKKLKINKRLVSHIKIENQSIDQFLSRGLKVINNFLKKTKPTLVIAQGDTSSTYLTALASYINNIKFAHLEAGLRTFNIKNPFPEEGYRQMISKISDINFCPTILNKKNLINEGVNKKSIHITGNTVIDSLKLFKINASVVKYNYSKFNVLITLHRRENFIFYFSEILEGLKKILEKFKDANFKFVIHTNPMVKKLIIKLSHEKFKNLNFIEPLEYQDFLNLMKEQTLLLTDSGGIQEECISLKIPTIVFRENTERVEGLKFNFIKLSKPSEKKLLNDFEKMTLDIKNNKMKYQTTNPYGDGKASKRISRIIRKEII